MTRDFHWLTSFARLKDGVTLAQAQASMNVIGARIAKDFPASNKNWGVIVERLRLDDRRAGHAHGRCWC
jgi:hypothetical protein